MPGIEFSRYIAKIYVRSLSKENIKTGIVVVENQGYILKGDYNKDNERLYCLCLNDNEFNW